MMEGIDVYDLVPLVGGAFNRPNLDNALLAFEHEGSYHLYCVKIRTSEIHRREGTHFIDRPEFEVTHYCIRDFNAPYRRRYTLKDIQDELEDISVVDKTIGTLLIKEGLHPQRSLDYKLNMAVAVYILAKRHSDEQELSDSMAEHTRN